MDRDQARTHTHTSDPSSSTCCPGAGMTVDWTVLLSFKSRDISLGLPSLNMLTKSWWYRSANIKFKIFFFFLIIYYVLQIKQSTKNYLRCNFCFYAPSEIQIFISQSIWLIVRENGEYPRWSFFILCPVCNRNYSFIHSSRRCPSSWRHSVPVQVLDADVSERKDCAITSHFTANKHTVVACVGLVICPNICSIAAWLLCVPCCSCCTWQLIKPTGNNCVFSGSLMTLSCRD